ncbi:MAG: transglycosylase domain-containing protein [Devosiaceae bacterium]|nr:transglycosylase domain-containing protein [Devosiaceae bacterium]
MLRLIGWLFGFGLFVGLVALGGVGYLIWTISEDLPDYTVLRDYAPPITTRVHAADGLLLAEFARERRLFQPIETVPLQVVNAFIAVEDKAFYQHGGISFEGILRAVRDNVLQRIEGGNGPLVGASTITQQVAKNFLLTSEQTWDRKIRELLLALKIESTFSKDKILELYLNEIFFGFNSYGIAAAAMNYFDKALYELTLSEAAYLAALPKGPANYHPFRRPQAAISRRNHVINRMLDEGYVTAESARTAKAQSLNVVPRRGGSRLYSAEYFSEEVRRELLTMYGEDQLYGGGLSVRTTLDPRLQILARKALMDGIVSFDETKGYRGPNSNIELGDDWGLDVFEIEPLWDVPEWSLAVVLEMERNEAKIGLRPAAAVSGGASEDRIVGQLPGPEMPWLAPKRD